MTTTPKTGQCAQCRTLGCEVYRIQGSRLCLYCIGELEAHWIAAGINPAPIIAAQGAPSDALPAGFAGA